MIVIDNGSVALRYLLKVSLIYNLIKRSVYFMLYLETSLLQDIFVTILRWSCFFKKGLDPFKFKAK